MKITFFIPDLKGGGAQHMIINMANEFARRQNEVTLLIGQKEGPYTDKIAPEVNTIDLNKQRTLSTYPALVSYLKAEQPDIFLSAMFYVNIVALLAKISLLNLKTKFIITERNLMSLRIQGSTKIRDKLSPVLIRLLYRLADQIIAISEGVADDLTNITKLPPHKIKWIHNPVITRQTLEYLNETPSAPLTKDQKTIITSGRLVPQKDYHTLLNAFSKIQNCQLIILGEGELEQELKQKAKQLNIEENIHFMGFVKNPLALMKQADLFVLSSQWEGFGNVLVEALLCGLPIVSTNCRAGPSEILADGQYGTLVPVGDSQSLAKAIEKAINTPHDPDIQKKRALEFSVEKICDQYETVMHQITGTQP